MSSFKVIALAVLGFLLPVIIGISAQQFLSNDLSGSKQSFWSQFSNSEKTSDIEGAMLRSEASVDSDAARRVPVEEPKNQVALDSDPKFDPSSAGLFIVSMNLRFDGMPEPKSMFRVIAKYNWNVSPYTGWAFALRGHKTSIRPEVYWQGDNGQGGWFPFEEYSFTPGKWYSITLVANARNFINLYVEEVVELNNALGQKDAKSAPTFLGGFSVAEITPPVTNAALYFGAKKNGPAAFHGKLLTVLIATVADVPSSRESIMRLVSGGPSKIHDRVPKESIGLWISEQDSVSLETPPEAVNKVP